MTQPPRGPWNALAILILILMVAILILLLYPWGQK